MWHALFGGLAKGGLFRFASLARLGLIGSAAGLIAVNGSGCFAVHQGNRASQTINRNIPVLSPTPPPGFYASGRSGFGVSGGYGGGK